MDLSGYKRLDLKELQALQLDAIKIIHSVCVKHRIDYYMIGGTLLGSIRHGGYIPWDDDIDIAMTRVNYERFKMVFPNEKDFNEKLFLQHYMSDSDFGLALMRVCLKGTFIDWPAQNHLNNCKNTYIDIFPLDNVPSDESLQKRQASAMKILNYICNLKLYGVRTASSTPVLIAKRSCHLLLKLVPIRFLVNLKLHVMTKYDNCDCEYLCSMQSHYSYFKQRMKKEIYGKPILLKFEDTELYGPALYKDYLSQLFGDYMKLPPVDKQPRPLDAYIKR